MMLKRVGLWVGMVVWLCAIATAQTRVSEIFGKTLESYGLGHLSEEDKARVRSLLDGLNEATIKNYRERAEVYDSAIEYWQKQGYEPEDISFVRRDNRWLFVVGRTFPVYTTDYSPMFPIDTLPNGRYLVRKTVTGGISELIAKGKIVDFRYAK